MTLLTEANRKWYLKVTDYVEDDAAACGLFHDQRVQERGCREAKVPIRNRFARLRLELRGSS